MKLCEQTTLLQAYLHHWFINQPNIFLMLNDWFDERQNKEAEAVNYIAEAGKIYINKPLLQIVNLS